MQNQMGGMRNNNFSPEVMNHNISVEVQFPDQAVGVIIGKGGAVLKEISIRSSAKVLNYSIMISMIKNKL